MQNAIGSTSTESIMERSNGSIVRSSIKRHSLNDFKVLYDKQITLLCAADELIFLRPGPSMICELQDLIHFATLRQPLIFLQLLQSTFLHTPHLHYTLAWSNNFMIIFRVEWNSWNLCFIEIITGDHSVFLKPFIDKNLAVRYIQNACYVLGIIGKYYRGYESLIGRILAFTYIDMVLGIFEECALHIVKRYVSTLIISLYLTAC